jgi:RNA polymerase sigma-70 factor (ECF subfamily)
MTLREVSTPGDEAAPDPLPGLLRRIADRDRMAFHELYLYASPRLYGIALKLTRDRQAASEALQDTLVQVWRNAARFDPARGTAEAWLTGILRYRAHDARDALRRQGQPEGLDDVRELADPASLERLEGSIAHIRLRRCLAQLEDKNRIGIILAYVHGYTHSEIAKRLQLPLGSVKAWIRRGLLTLKTCVAS